LQCQWQRQDHRVQARNLKQRGPHPKTPRRSHDRNPRPNPASERTVQLRDRWRPNLFVLLSSKPRVLGICASPYGVPDFNGDHRPIGFLPSAALHRRQGPHWRMQPARLDTAPSQGSSSLIGGTLTIEAGAR
jgi:hypothetical protein